MNPIADAIIEEAWKEISGVSSPEHAKRLSDEFARDQPALAEYVADATQGMSEGSAELGWFVALVVWRAFIKGTDRPLKSVEEEAVNAQYERTREWLDSLGTLDPILLEKTLKQERAFPQAQLMHFISEAIFESSEDGFEVTPEEQARLFLVLKVFCDSLHAHAVTEPLLH